MKKNYFIAGLALATLIAFSCTKKTHPVTTVASDSPPVATSTTDPIAGEKMYTSSCGRCHELPNPDAYTAAQWRPIMEKMADKAKLNTAQKTDVLAYVIRNAKPAK